MCSAADPGEEAGVEEEQQMGDAILMTEVAREMCNEPQVTDEGGSKEQNPSKSLGINIDMVAICYIVQRPCNW